MAKEIRINNSCILKRRLDITDIIGNENYGISYLDENFRRTDDEGEACFTVLYDKTCIGRGVQVNGIGNKNSIHLAVSLPCTEEEFRNIFRQSATHTLLRLIFIGPIKTPITKFHF